MTKAVNQTYYYTVANFLRYSSSILMLPIYTRWLTPADYGTVELMTMILDFVGLLVCNRIGESIYRYYKLANSESKEKEVISTSFIISALLNFIGFLIILSLSGWLSPMVSGEDNFLIVFIVFAFTLVLEAFNAIPLIYIRLKERARFYLYISIIKLTLQIVFNILFVVYYELHVAGVIFSAFICSSIVGTILSFVLIKENGFHFSRKTAKSLLVFSAPLIVVSLSSFIVTFGDRFFLKVYSSLEDVGIYSLSYRLAFAFTALFWVPFNQYWQVKRYDVYKSENAKLVFEKTFTRINTYILCFLLLYALIIPLFIQIMASDSFARAAIYAPIITGAMILHMWAQYFSFSLYLKKKTWVLAKIEIASGIFSTGCYWFFISKWQIEGAVLATLLGYVFRLSLIYKMGQSYYEIPVKLLQSIIAYLGVFLLIILFQLTSNDSLISLTINSVLTSLGLALLLFKYLGHEDLNLMRKSLYQKRIQFLLKLKRQ